MTLVLHPQALERALFATPGYRDQAEMLFRGLESNGLLLTDSQGRLLAELNNRVQGLSTKDGLQLQIRLEELQKKRRRRVVVADPHVCHCPQSHSLLDTALTVHQVCSSDTLVIDGALQSQLDGRANTNLTRLDSYITSTYEQERHYCSDQLPPIDTMQPGEFDQHMIRCTRFSSLLRFYDKQIGHGSSLGGFRDGIGKIVSLWVKNAHFPKAGLAVEIYTCVPKTRDPLDVVHARIRDSLVRRLHDDHGVRATLFFKEDRNAITHDRYLQTNSIAVTFSRGFDFIKDNGGFHRCSIRIDNGAYEHLQDYRRLKDYKNPVTFQ